MIQHTDLSLSMREHSYTHVQLEHRWGQQAFSEQMDDTQENLGQSDYLLVVLTIWQNVLYNLGQTLEFLRV